MSNNVPKYIPKKHTSKIQHWDDERSIGNSLIISLKRGHAFNSNEQEHVRGFDTINEVLDALRSEVKPCYCDDCCKAS